MASVVDGLSKASIMVLCGSRIDLLNHSRQCLVKHFPKCRPWIAQLTNGQHQIWSQKTGLPHLLAARAWQADKSEGRQDATHLGHIEQLLGSNATELFSVRSCAVRGFLFRSPWLGGATAHLEKTAVLDQGRAAPVEQSRLRCLDRNCPLRSEEEKKNVSSSGNSRDPNQETTQIFF